MAKEKKKPGAQPGNKNAYKHGFYTPRFTPDEKAQITQADSVDVLSEITLLRVYINRVAKKITLKDDKITPEDIAGLTLLTNMSTAVSTHVRTHHLVNGKSSEVEKSIQEAIEEIRLEMGI